MIGTALLVFVALVVVTEAFDIGGPNTYTFTEEIKRKHFGVMKTNDKLLDTVHIRKLSGEGVLHKTYKFPEDEKYSKEEIHLIVVESPNPENKGGFVHIAHGGVGHHFAKLDFKSAPGRGMDFHVELYGQ